MSGFVPMRWLHGIGSAVFAAATLSACAPSGSMVSRAAGQAPQLVGPKVTRNTTPLGPSFRCMADVLRERTPEPLKIGVGQVRDYTGKFSEADGGSAITQGGSLMTFSALGKLGNSVRTFERFDTQITEWELGFISRRYLGDERQHAVNNNGQVQDVPWLPYLGGSVVQTDYFIIGGITELNYSINTGGARLQVNQMGPSARVYVANVAIDLRLVDTHSLEVLQTVSLQKQVVGREVKLSVFEFFDDILVDMEGGSKNDEPMQLAVRTTLEEGVLQLLGAQVGVDPMHCIDYRPNNLAVGLNAPGPLRKPPPAIQVLPATPAADPAPADAIAPPPTESRAPAAAPRVTLQFAPGFAAPPETAYPAQLAAPGRPGPRGLGIQSSRRPAEGSTQPLEPPQ